MVLVFAIVRLYDIFSFRPFLIFTFVKFLFFLNLGLIYQTEASTIPSCPSFVCFSLTRVTFDRLFIRKFVFDVCMFCVYFVD